MAGRSRKRLLRLEIAPVIAQAEQLAARVQQELPTHSGIARAADGVANAAREAEYVARSVRRPWSFHRLPAAFLAVALLVLCGWIYTQFFRISTLTIAMPQRDAIDLQERLFRDRRVRFEQRITNGSRENVALLAAGEVDLAFVQGGVPIPAGLPRRELAQTELVLLFLRPGREDPRQMRHVLTSVEGQGSHSVALDFVRLWGIEDEVDFIHQWGRLTDEAAYEVPADVDAVFAIKDPSNAKTYRAAKRLREAGFRMFSPDLGARALSLDYLQPSEIPASYLGWEPPVPDQPTATYSVATFLVARQGLTPRVMAAAGHLLDVDAEVFWDQGFEPTVSDAGEVLQAAEAFLGILVYIGLAFLALLGVEVTTYRRRFHELNTLISLISIHQSDKDVLGISHHERLRENLLYLSICSDLLGLISVISGYYAQENSSLLYSNLLEIIHHRSNGLKLNIQTKILHAAIDFSPPIPNMVSPSETEAG